MAAKSPKYNKYLQTVRSISSTGPANDSDQIILVDTSSGSVTLNLLPAASVEGQTLTIKKTTSANSLIIDADGAETIEDYSTFTLTHQNDTITIVSDGAKWVGTSSNRNRIVDYISLSGNVGASATGVASLAYSNLVVGKRYRVWAYLDVFGAGNTSGADSPVLQVIHNSVAVSRVSINHSGSGGGDQGGGFVNAVGETFTAVNTNLSANISLGIVSTVYGNGTTQKTHYYIEDMDAI